MDPATIQQVAQQTGAIGAAAVLIPEILELLKQSTWFKWMSDRTPQINRIIGGVLAFCVGLGIKVTFNHEDHSLLVTGLAWASLGHGLGQWAVQQAYYRIGIAKTTLTQPPITVPVVKDLP